MSPRTVVISPSVPHTLGTLGTLDAVEKTTELLLLYICMVALGDNRQMAHLLLLKSNNCPLDISFAPPLLSNKLHNGWGKNLEFQRGLKEKGVNPVKRLNYL